MIKIGATIPTELSGFLREFTNREEWGDAAGQNTCSPSTMREIVYRNVAVTAKNLPALKTLMKKAAENADQKIKNAKSCKKNVNQMLDCI